MSTVRSQQIRSDHFRSVTKMVVHGIARAFSPHRNHRAINLGRWPRMLGQRGIKPEALPPEQDIQSWSAASKPTKKVGKTSWTIAEATIYRLKNLV